MQEVETGRLDLEAPVRRYLPEFRLQRDEWSDSVLVRRLLTHTTGLILPLPTRGRAAARCCCRRDGGGPRPQPANRVFSYSNLGFAIAGRVAELLSTGAFEDLVERRIFQPLGMSNSTVRTHEALSRRYASGHLVRGDRVAIAHPWHLVRGAAAYGGVLSDVRDQLRWLASSLAMARLSTPPARAAAC